MYMAFLVDGYKYEVKRNWHYAINFNSEMHLFY